MRIAPVILSKRIPSNRSSLFAPRSYPEGVDAAKLEMYLTDDDFQKVFALSVDEFQGLPQWKRIQKKKDVSLF